MSNKNRNIIFLDASIRNDKLGIGIYHQTKKHKFFKSLYLNGKNINTSFAEKMALYTAMKYAYNNNLSNIVFCTDNLTITNNDSFFELLKKFPLKDSSLIWIPRELNSISDSLSKQGSNITITDIENYAINSSRTNTTTFTDLSLIMGAYSFEQKINFLKKIAISHMEYEVIRMLKNGSKDVYKFCYNKDISAFLLIVNTIIFPNERTTYVNKRLKKTFKNKSNTSKNTTISVPLFNKFVKNRLFEKSKINGVHYGDS
jgi:hypothetical protein